MKKAAILSITAFYLLLTTGMFVCIINCAANSLVNQQHAMQMNNSRHKKTMEGKMCSCCKHKPAYIIKENLKPAGYFLVSPFAALINPAALPQFNIAPSLYLSQVWINANAPPSKSGKAIIIQNRSLLI